MEIKDKVVTNSDSFTEIVEIKIDTNEGIFIDLEYTNTDESNQLNKQKIKLNEKVVKKIIAIYRIAKSEEQETHDNLNW